MKQVRVTLVVISIDLIVKELKQHKKKKRGHIKEMLKVITVPTLIMKLTLKKRIMVKTLRMLRSKLNKNKSHHNKLPSLEY